MISIYSIALSVVSQSDYANLETCAKNAIKEKQQFVRLEMKKEELLEMFKVSSPLTFIDGILRLLLEEW